ncbi:DUF3427 domain-containing protein [Halobacillus litoralis]|uniref:DUF3427 domain-containing protein n=1 Tax=Halobacillus litoralis TaxID=45668 RepID=UPI0013714F9B|nr:DEAD/DEAH box helicase [Halobacillus litoralis]MYL39215.1 DUF3427 domain-containing protein [Halobacillus litoralis]
MESIIEQLQNSFHKGFIDREFSTSTRFRPELLVNNKQQRKDVLTSLVDELKNCRSFMFSVAFITESGLATLKSHLLDLKSKGVRGKILTSTYQMFNKPKVFKELLKLDNVEVRIADVEGFHSKGYIFQHDTHVSLIVGSSNLTTNALKVNYEWNIKLTSHENGEIIHHFNDQFQVMWDQADHLSLAWIMAYEESYQPPQFFKVAEKAAPYEQNKLGDSLSIQPNQMQEAALEGIQQVRTENEEKALIVSATGTGKTYLSAFDVRRARPKRMLFIVHREQILHKAKSDFQKVLGGEDKDFGILSGTKRETDARYLFATVQTISKSDVMRSFDQEEFDYILIDEVHKAGAQSYLKLIDYFKPQFLLGMTATPERTDGFNLFELFDYNVAYEIRLQEALEADMLTHFHYFGVTDLSIEGHGFTENEMFTYLTADERVDHVLEKVEYYGYSGDRVAGLIFCSTKKEAEQLSHLMNQRGYNTDFLTGDHSQETRQAAVQKLENGALDYILTVDIFNEGIDIPCINQVVMLRQTQSSIVFIQQLGRGLRKHDTKDFVTVIDFIGNYENNYLIPIALSGDHSQNKDNIRRRVIDTSYIQGKSTINFEEVAKERIYESIRTANLTQMKVLRDAYKELKNRIGRIPMLVDFQKHHSIDPLVLVDKKGNYVEFLEGVKEEVGHLTHRERQILTMLSQEVLNGKRINEPLLLRLLLDHSSISYPEYKEKVLEQGGRVDKQTLHSVERMFSLEFFKITDQKKYGNKPIIIFEGNQISWEEEIASSLNENAIFRTFVHDIVDVAMTKSKSYSPAQPFTLFEKYSRKDACKLLNWENDESSTVYGYKPKYGTCPIFVTYHKPEEVESSVNYEDGFLNPEVLTWYSRSKRTLQSNEVVQIVEAEQKENDLHIFVKKDNGEGSDFYYLGQAIPDQNTVEQTTMNDGDKEIPVVRMNMKLEHQVNQKIYDYLHE